MAIPFVRALGELMPTTATRLRRDYPSLLCLVRAHAILHQERRRLDDGRIVATVEEDYAAVRELVGELIAEGVEASVSQATRETVEAVHALQDEGKQHVSAKAVSERLKVGRSAAYDRIRRALKAGYLVNEAPKDERAFRLVVGASLPDAADFLPLPEDVAEEVVRVCPDRLSGHDFGSTMRDSEPLSGCPGRSAEPGENLFGEEDAA